MQTARSRQHTLASLGALHPFSRFGTMAGQSKGSVSACSPSPGTDCQDVRGLVCRLARASLVLDHTDVNRVERLCEAAKRFLFERAAALVRKASGLPILRCYSSDATPGTSEERRRMTSSLDPMATADRRGKSTKDYLMQICWFKTVTPAGVTLRTPVFRDGQPLSQGKTMWHLWQAMREFGPTLAELGHTGLSIEFFCADRGCYESMETKVRQQHSLMTPSAVEVPELSKMKQLFCSAACALHDGQNALKWALYFWMGDTSLMKDLHIIIASLRNSYEDLAGHIGSWLRLVLAFDQDDEWDEPGWSHTWQAIGTAPQLVEIVLKLRLTWGGGKLHVAKEFEDNPNIMSDVSMLVLAMMQFENFSDSRWLGAGPACRCMLRSMMVGLESLVRFVRADRSVSDFHLGGFERLCAKSRIFIGVASLVSYIPEALQAELLEDPRVPMRVDALEASVREEAEWAMSLPEFFWSALAGVLGCSAASLRHDVSVASVVAVGFMTRRVFRAARQLPWTLCAGSVAKNLIALEGGPCPTEDASKKLWQLMKVRYPREQLVAAVGLLRSCPWTIQLNEQMHGQQAAIRKLHKGYCRRVLTARSMVGLLRPLVMIPEEDQCSPKVDLATQVRLCLPKALRRASQGDTSGETPRAPSG